MTRPAPIRVAIVDDHPVVRMGWRHLISESDQFEVCGEAETCSGAIKLIETCSPAIIICDITLKEGSGLDLVAFIAKSNSRCRSLVVSMHDEAVYAERVIRSGANGYLNKESAIDELLTALTQIARDEVYLSPSMTRSVLGRMHSSAPGAKSGLDSLTDRELEVLTLIGEGRTTREIADGLFLSPRTIDTYRERIRRKLDIENGTALARFAFELQSQGYVASAG